MQLPRTKFLWGFLGLAFACLSIIAACLWPDPRGHQRSVVPLTNQVSISDRREVLDANWLKQRGFRTLIYLRHDRFLDLIDKSSDEANWIKTFDESAKKIGLLFLVTGPHNRKFFISNACQLKLAMEDGHPPILIYADRTRRAGLIWAFAEALRPQGFSPDDIVAAASAFEQPVPEFYQRNIAHLYSEARDQNALPPCSDLRSTPMRAVANAPNPQKLEPLYNKELSDAVFSLPTGASDRIFDALWQLTVPCQPCADSVRQELYGISVAGDGIAYSGCGWSKHGAQMNCGESDALAIWDRASNRFLLAVDRHRPDGRHGSETETYPSLNQWPNSASRYYDIWAAGEKWPSANDQRY